MMPATVSSSLDLGAGCVESTIAHLFCLGGGFRPWRISLNRHYDFRLLIKADKAVADPMQRLDS